MNDFPSLLLFAALFFFMMRFGCGAHGSHDRKHIPGDDQHSHQH